MKPELIIITPCSRPENKPKIEKSIEAAYQYFTITWLCPTIPTKDPYGNLKRNNCLKLIPDRSDFWIKFLDDDNELHPNFGKVASRIVQSTQADLLLFHQLEGNSLKAMCNPPKVKARHMDTDQMLIRASCIKKAFWPPNIYEADYEFAKMLVDQGAKVEIRPEILAQYNSLRRIND